MRFFPLLIGLLCLLVGVSTVAAQDTTTVLPASYQLNGVQHIYQTWNNCGPATLTMGLTFYGYNAEQQPAADWLKPNAEDKNVSPWQIIEYVNTQLPGTTRALLRQGGTLETLKLLISNEFPVMIEAGYDPPNDPQGWMGHYLMVYGYDDGAQILRTMDSFEGPNYTYDYAYIDEFWRHFNRVYIVLYPFEREAELMALLGDDADEAQNWVNALEAARLEAVANQQDPFAWFNMGTNFVGTGMYAEAAVAFDQARNVGGGLPFRMLWYQFGPFEAYYQTARYNDMIQLAQQLLNDGGGHLVEETFYYGGLARLGLGETERARSNFQQAIFFNPNFTPAREALAQLDGG
ncbi:MAG: C39 family peptidase [Chloroflexota bacterium]|nr:C39 family peptidase [Chloroflexota bacterium]